MSVIAGVKGLVIILDPVVGAPNITTLTGTTCTVTIADGAGDVHGVYTATVASDGKTAIYTTVGTEFPSPGSYKLQLSVVDGAGNTLYSEIQSLTVYPRL